MMDYRLFEEQYALSLELEAKFARKRLNATNTLIELIEQIEPTFEPLSIKLYDIFTTDLGKEREEFLLNYPETFSNFCNESWYMFYNYDLKEINAKYKDKVYGEEVLSLDVDGSRFYIENSGVYFKDELESLKGYGTLREPYASACLLEMDIEGGLSEYVDSAYEYDTVKKIVYRNERLEEAIKHLEEGLKDTIRYFNKYIEPTKELYVIYIDFMNNYVELYKEYIDEEIKNYNELEVI